MFIVRPLEQQDLEELLGFAQSTQGLYTLPGKRELLQEHLDRSLRSFSADNQVPSDEYYEFALINTDTQKLCGIAAIMATSGIDHALHLAKVEKDQLIPLSPETGPSELCSLFISKPNRELGLGKLLSLSRIHFIAAFPHRFHPQIIANMRGLIDQNGESPFWKSIGPKNLHFTPKELDEMVAASSPRLKAILPDRPLPLSHLSAEAVAAMGKTHPNTQVALSILQGEGFKPNGLVDLIDAGPQIEAHRDELTSLKNSRLLTLQEIVDSFPTSQNRYLISNNRLDFRAILDEATGVESNHLTLTKRGADALSVKVGDPLRLTLMSSA